MLRCPQILLLALLWSGQSLAAGAPIIPPAPSVAGSSYLLMDATTGDILVEHEIDTPVPPASLTKIMTSYIATVELDAGRISMDDMVDVSVKAWRTPGSRMFIKEGTQVSVSDLLHGIIVQSGNDASVALAEFIAGSESAFADMMNQQAVQLGMTGSQFANATGLPNESHYATARDLATLTRAMIQQHPDAYEIYALKSFTYGDIEQPNRNRLLWRDRTVDGVKTGHTEAAGYCLVASAERNGMRLITVVTGTKSDDARMQESQKLLSYGFRYFETREIYPSDHVLETADIWYGMAETVDLGITDQVVLTIPRGSYDALDAALEVDGVLEAPLAVGDKVGEVQIRLHDDVIYKAPLVALEAVAQGGLFSRLSDYVELFFRQLLAGDDAA